VTGERVTRLGISANLSVNPMPRIDELATRRRAGRVCPKSNTCEEFGEAVELGNPQLGIVYLS